MGETSDWLEQHGAPGMIHCLRSCTFVNSRCRDCKAFVEAQGYEADGCPTVTGEEMASDFQEFCGLVGI